MVGISMAPTLVEPMILETELADYYHIGDVVVFVDRNRKTIVHRIVKQTRHGFITRGDNNLTNDEPIVQQDIRGKVVAAYRGEKRYRVNGGKYGYLLHCLLQIRKKKLNFFRKILSFWYYMLSGSGFFVKLLPQKYKPKIIQYQNAQAHLYIGNFLAGRYDLRLKRWIIFRPWRIFVDEKSLPLSNVVLINPEIEKLQNISLIMNSENTLIPSLNEKAWNDMFELADKQGITCYLYYALKQKKSEDLIPIDWQCKIRIQLMQFSAGNVKHLHELEELSLLSEKTGLQVIFLKGSHLAFHVYPSPSLRPMGDIDIMVKEEDLPKIIGLLAEAGYSCDYFTLENLKKFDRHLPPFTKKGRKTIELHWTLIQPMFQTSGTQKTMTWLIGETEGKQFGKGLAPVFKPNALLFQIMLHIGLNDGLLPSLKNLMDIMVIIQKHQKEIHWEVITNKIVETNFAHRFALVGWLAKTTVGANIPDQFFQSLNVELCQEIKEAALNRILHFSDIDLNGPIAILNQANLLQKLVYVLKYVFMSPSKMKYRHNLKNNWSVFIYYPKRIFDFTRSYKTNVIKTLHPDLELMAKTKKELKLRMWLDNQVHVATRS